VELLEYRIDLLQGALEKLVSKLVQGQDVSEYLPTENDDISINKIVELLSDEDNSGNRDSESPVASTEASVLDEDSPVSPAVPIDQALDTDLFRYHEGHATLAAAMNGDLASDPSTPDSLISVQHSSSLPVQGVSGPKFVSPSVLLGSSPGSETKYGGRIHIPGRKASGHVHQNSGSPYDLDDYLHKRSSSRKSRSRDARGGSVERTVSPLVPAVRESSRFISTPPPEVVSLVDDDAGFVFNHLDPFVEMEDLNSNLDELWLGGIRTA
jgi:hypothetical protein